MDFALGFSLFINGGFSIIILILYFSWKEADHVASQQPIEMIMCRLIKGEYIQQFTKGKLVVTVRIIPESTESASVEGFHSLEILRHRMRLIEKEKEIPLSHHCQFVPISKIPETVKNIFTKLENEDLKSEG